MRESTMDVDGIGDIDTNRHSIMPMDQEVDIETLLNKKAKVGKERRTAKLKKKPKKAINMEENGELISSIRIDKLMIGDGGADQMDEMKKLFELAGLSKRETKKILNNEKGMMERVATIISAFDPNALNDPETSTNMFDAQADMFTRDNSKYVKRQATTVELKDRKSTRV